MVVSARKYESWGHGAVPAYACQLCHRTIGSSGKHFIFTAGLLLCARCVSAWNGSSRAAHLGHYPGCTEKWHDMWDHFEATADRLGAWFALSRQRCAGAARIP